MYTAFVDDYDTLRDVAAAHHDDACMIYYNDDDLGDIDYIRRINDVHPLLEVVGVPHGVVPTDRELSTVYLLKRSIRACMYFETMPQKTKYAVNDHLYLVGCVRHELKHYDALHDIIAHLCDVLSDMIECIQAF